MKKHTLGTALEKGLEGQWLPPAEALRLAALPQDSMYEVLAVSEKVRRTHLGVEVNLCSIVNAKSGLCKEDCSFCAQSVKYSTGVTEYPMSEPEKIVKAASEAAAFGAREFSIVTSGTAIEKERDIAALTSALQSMKESVQKERCASLGILSRETLKKLKDSGLESYHHNLETGRSFFPKICTTHEYDRDVAVVKAAKEEGFYVCSGGIFGLGEKWAHRVELAATLKELDVDSVPINFLNPRPGTPLEKAKHPNP